MQSTVIELQENKSEVWNSPFLTSGLSSGEYDTYFQLNTKYEYFKQIIPDYEYPHSEIYNIAYWFFESEQTELDDRKKITFIDILAELGGFLEISAILMAALLAGTQKFLFETQVMSKIYVHDKS